MSMGTWVCLEEEAVQVAVVTREKSKSTCELLEHALSTLADGFEIIGREDMEVTRVQMGLYSQNLNSLKCSIDLAYRGYYTQSVNLLRGVYENWIAFWYLADFPEKAQLWLSRDHQPPSHSEMLSKLGLGFVEDKGVAREWYRILCKFAHPDYLTVVPHLGSRDGEPRAFFGATYKGERFASCAWMILQFINLMLRDIGLWAPPSEPWLKRCTTVMERVLEFLQRQT